MLAMTSSPKILVLAGRRSATLDPLAARFEVSHKALVPVLGEAMIGRVLKIVEEAFPEAPLYVSVEDFELIRSEPTVARLHAAGRLKPVDAREHIVDSIVHAAGTTGFPLLVTTADNVLMTPIALRQLHREGMNSQSHALVAMARKEDIRATHPDGQRRFYEFKGGGYSNCNMFWLGSERALRATETFRHGGQFAKKPERIIKAFGVMNLIRFRMGRHTLRQMFGFISTRFGVDIRPVVMDEGRLAIDVDNERTHAIAEEVLGRETRG
jgi:GTP:adenosylcobinamide-phosphate guanylyltransferase